MTAPPTRPPLTRAQKNVRFALRVMWLLTKGFLLGIMMVVALAALALWQAPRIINGNRVRGMIVDRLSGILHRRVEIDGLVFTLQGAKLKGLRVYSRADPQQKTLESDYALVTIKLQPLINERKLEISHVKLGSPKVRVWRDAQGRWSFADILVSSSTQAAAPLQIPLALSADRTDVENGAIEIDDHLKNTTVVVDKINLSVDRLSLDKPFRYRLSCDDFDRLGKRRFNGAISMEGMMSLASLDWTKAFVRAQDLDVRIEGREVKGSVSVSGFPQTTADLDLSAPPLSAAELGSLTGSTVTVALPASRWRGRLRLAQPAALEVERFQVQSGPFQVSGSGTVDWSKGKPAVAGTVTLNDFPLDQAGSFRPSLARYGLRGTAQLQAVVEGDAQRLRIKKLLMEGSGVDAVFSKAKITGSDFTLGAVDDFKKTTLDVTKADVDAFSNSFTSVSGSLVLDGRELRLDGLKLRWRGSRARLKGRIVDVANPKRVEVSGSLDKLQWGDAEDLVKGIMAAVASSTRAAAAVAQAPADEETRVPWVRTFKYVIPKKFPDTVGHIHVGETSHKDFEFKNTDLMWDLRGVTPSLKNVSGEVRIGFGPGRVNDVQALQSYHKFLKIIFLPYVYMNKMNSLSVLKLQLYPKTLDFNRIEGQYAVNRGVVDTRFTHIDSPQLVAFAAGTADFGRELVDMNILTRLTSYNAPLPEWWVDELGRPAIGFRVKGDLNDPEVEPNIHKMPADEIEKDVAAAKGRAEQRFQGIEKLETGEGAK